MGLRGPRPGRGKHQRGVPSPTRGPVKVHRYLRCPCCGSLRSPEKFEVEYTAEAREKHLRGYRAITWTTAKLTPVERGALKRALARGMERT